MTGMASLRSRLPFPERSRPTGRVALVILTFILVTVPALDLGWVEPTLDQGASCQLHSNPGTAVGLACLVVSLPAELLPPSESPARSLLLGFPIFIPPRV